MKIDTAATTYTQTFNQTGASASATATSEKSATESSASVTTTSSQDTTTVTNSGRALMLQRLFGTSDPNASPPVATGNGYDRSNSGMLSVYYLTESDRSLVSNMYAYAKQQGADLEYVDQVALTLSNYRQADNGRLWGSFNGHQVDAEGHALTSSYNETDTATANRILNGTAINSTLFDKRFLRDILDPGSALSNSSTVRFLEKMVVKFSDEETQSASLDASYATYSAKDFGVNSAVITASKDVVYTSPKAQIANIDGKWFILDPNLLNDPSFKGVPGHQKLLSASDINEAMLKMLLG